MESFSVCKYRAKREWVGLGKIPAFRRRKSLYINDLGRNRAPAILTPLVTRNIFLFCLPISRPL